MARGGDHRGTDAVDLEELEELEELELLEELEELELFEERDFDELQGVNRDEPGWETARGAG